MNTYELMVIFDSDLSEKIAKDNFDNVVSSLKKAGSEMGKTDEWGKKKFAYPIDKKEYGYYFVQQFKANPTVIEPIKKDLLLADEVVRHIFLKIPQEQYKES